MTLTAPIRGRAGTSRSASPIWPKAAVAGSAWFIGVLFLCFLATPFGRAVGQSAQDRPVLLIDIKGAIGFVAAGQLTKAVEQAAAQGSPAVIVRLDTPGGLLTSTRDMIHTILSSRVPIIMYVAPNGSRAASAGTYLMYASHVAAMAPSTHLGAATPIALSPPGFPGSPPSKPTPDSDKPSETDPATASARKSVNDAVAYIRSLAELRGRNADWGEKAVREAATLTASAALKERVADVIAKDVDDLLSQINGRSITTAAGEVRLDTKGRSVIELKPDWKMQLMAVISDPNIALILLMIGIYGILFEFWNPGAIAPGVVGGICLIIALTALAVLPVNYAGLALLLFGVALMLAEAFTPGFGIAGLGGIVAFAVGALFLFDPSQSDVPIAVSWQVVAGMAVFSAAFFAGVMGFAMRARRRPVRTGAEQMIGSLGEVVSWMDNEGRVRVHGEVWEARSKQRLSTGQRVRVVSRTGLTLNVEAGT
ncbi:MAG: nodulation protein NfeD [Hyphomicrobiaceae bacterium]|nr:MAG: nodulation protein NfeD [Hyphomicrobiaceae bacterium]